MRPLVGPRTIAQLPSVTYHSATTTAFAIQKRLVNRGALAEGDSALMSIMASATLHGLVMLSLDVQTPVTSRSLESLTEAATELLLAGMGAVRENS